AKTAIPALVEALKDTDSRVRVQASLALGAIGQAAIPALIDATKQKNKYLQMGAALALGHMGPAAKGSVSALGELLSAKDVRVRCHAAQALWRIDRQTDRTVAALSDGVKCHDRPVQLSALTTLGLMGPSAKDAIPALREALDDPDAQV